MDFPEKVKKAWGAWDIRVFLFLSLLSQILLTFLAPFRKSQSRKRVTRFIWVAYIVADWVAIFALGLLSSGQDDSSMHSTRRDAGLLALWAPFLLLHLGGPDTITAFAVEDNELWLRQLFGLISQLLPAVYVLLRSIPGNKLLGPTIFIFIVGTVKYCERTWALYQASSDVFSNKLARKSKSARDNNELMEEYMVMIQTTSPREPRGPKKSDLVMTRYAFRFIHMCKGLFVDFPTDLNQLKVLRSFILRWSAEDAFTVIGIELNFMYDMLYTKAAVSHSGLGYVLRLISFSSIIAAFSLFLSADKSAHSRFDMAMTYTLFIGALSLEIIAVFILVISDWGIIALNKSSLKIASFLAKTQRCIFRGTRWSEVIPQLNIFTVALTGRQKWLDILVDFLCLKRILDEMRNTSRTPINDEVKRFILEKLKEKSRAKFIRHDQLQRQLKPKGKWAKASYLVLRMTRPLPNSHTMENIADSILVLHVATEICYNIAGKRIRDNVCLPKMDNPSSATERNVSKILSDYMLYLIVMQPSIMPSSGIWRIKYQDTCDKIQIIRAMELMDRKEYSFLDPYEPMPSLTSRDLEVVCSYLFSTFPWADQALPEFKDSSVLNDAVNLLKNLIAQNGLTWKRISDRWMEILCQTAGRSRARVHAQRLSEGGELLTFVWLLMTHLGLTDQVK